MDKKIRGIIATVLTIAMAGSVCLGIAGCGKKDQETVSVATAADDDTMRKEQGVMLVVVSEIRGPVNKKVDDPVTVFAYSIDWNGTVIMTAHHTDSDDEEMGRAVLSSDDYKTVSEFAEDAYNNNTYKGYSENDVSDGETFSFIYYPSGVDSATHLYDGYCYSNESLWNIVTIVRSYFQEPVEATPTPNPELVELKSHSGVMVTIYDEENDINYIVRWSGEISSDAYEKSKDDRWEYKGLSDEDYMTLYRFAQSAYENASYEDYSGSDAGNGRWQFKYYPPNDRNEYKIYSGVIGDDSGLNEIAEMVSSYF